jgi:hypothetical protein
MEDIILKNTETKNMFIQWVLDNKTEITDTFVRRWILDLYDETKIYSMFHIKVEFKYSEDRTQQTSIELICTPNSNIGS